MVWSMVSPTLANFLFEAANFVLLAGALGYFSFAPLRKALQSERDRHAHELQAIAEQREQAEALSRAATEAHEQLDAELATQREHVRAQAEAEAKRIEHEAREAADTQRRTFEREQEAFVHATTERLADAIAQLAASSVRALLEQLDGPDLDLALVRGACASLATLPPGDAQASATVECARALSDEARAMLREQLGPFDDRVVPELGAGVRVTTAVGQVDASAQAIAREAAHELARIVTAVASQPTPEQPDAQP